VLVRAGGPIKLREEKFDSNEWLPKKSGKFHNLGLTLRPSGNIRNGTARN
jgi:hypothetical protein